MNKLRESPAMLADLQIETMTDLSAMRSINLVKLV